MIQASPPAPPSRHGCGTRGSCGTPPRPHGSQRGGELRSYDDADHHNRARAGEGGEAGMVVLVKEAGDRGEVMEEAGDQGEVMEEAGDQGEVMEEAGDQGEVMEEAEDQGEVMEEAGDRGKVMEEAGDQGEVISTVPAHLFSNFLEEDKS